jgi:L-fuculose-phosphate aldolase
VSGPDRTHRAALATAARRVAEHGLVIGTGGNLSVRHGDVVLVTATGVDLATCGIDDVVLVDLAGRTLDDPGPEPTSELALHLGVYADSGAQAVVHVHAPYSTAIACVLEELPVIHYQQLSLGGVVRVAPYATFGTVELADAVREALRDRSVALMANHGAVATGDTLARAIERALLLEWLCALHHRASALGTPRVLSEDEQSEVVMAALARNYGNRG